MGARSRRIVVVVALIAMLATVMISSLLR